MFKIIGAILTVAGCALYGYKRAEIPNKRYKNLVYFNQGLAVLENQLKFSNNRIDRILFEVADVTGFNKIFKTCAEDVSQKPISKKWCNAVEKDVVSLFFTKSDEEIIMMLSQELGMTHREGQIKNINRIRCLIEENIKIAREEYFREAKMIKGLGLMAGLFLAIMLI